jgi:hypothetical protein
MLHPDSLVKKIWNGVLAVLLIYTATIMPYRMAFIESEMWDAWFFVELTIDTLFFVDVVVNL